MKFVKWFIIAVTTIGLMGCTVISADRVFPTVAFAWTKKAQRQRDSDLREKAAIKAYQESLKTNSVPK